MRGQPRQGDGLAFIGSSLAAHILPGMSSRKLSTKTSRRAALAGGAALVVGGVAAANAFAQQQAPPNEDVLFLEGPLEDRRKAWIKAVADKLGVTPEKLDQAIQDASKDVGPMLLPPPPLAGEAGTFTLRLDGDLAAAAKAIGISEDQLRAEAATKSLSDVAQAHGVDPNAVAQALKAQRRQDIEKAVAAGNLPLAMADRLKANIDDEIDRFVRLPGFRGNFIFRFERSER